MTSKKQKTPPFGGAPVGAQRIFDWKKYKAIELLCQIIPDNLAVEPTLHACER
jgi:hypothetical protein